MTLNRFQTLASRAALLAAFGAALPAQAANGLQFSTGADYASGDYGGTTNTEVVVVPLSARLRWEGWSLRGTLPYVTVKGPADVTVLVDDSSGASGGGGGGSGGGSSSGSGRGGSGSGSGSGGVDDSGGTRGGNDSFSNNRSVSGLGDAALSLTRSFDKLAGTSLYADVTGRVKFATGRESDGLGVGTTDYGLGGEIGYAGSVGGVYASAGRRFLGSTATLKRVDGWQWSGGGWIALGDRLELGGSYNWRAASVSGGVDSRSLEASLNVLLARNWQAGLFAGKGLSKGSADYSAGFSLAWSLPFQRS